MGGKNNGFFFFWCGCDSITVLTFLQEKKKTLKGMLFQNLYENILVRQKLKMNQDNPLINSIDYFHSFSRVLVQLEVLLT